MENLKARLRLLETVFGNFGRRRTLAASLLMRLRGWEVRVMQMKHATQSLLEVAKVAETPQIYATVMMVRGTPQTVQTQ